MATSVTIGFDADHHTLDDMGWAMSYSDGTGNLITTYYDSYTLASAAAQNILTADLTIDNILRAQVTNTYITTGGAPATINTNLQTKRTAEGLDPTTTPV